jgi:hypothetical protein
MAFGHDVIVVTINRWRTACIHGDKSQGERDYVLNGKCVFVYGWLRCL